MYSVRHVGTQVAKKSSSKKSRVSKNQSNSVELVPVQGIVSHVAALFICFGNAAGDDLDMPEVGLSVTMFLNDPFHTQVKSCR